MMQTAFSPAAPQMALNRPQGAAAAYGSVIRGTEDPREIEYRVLARATTLLDMAQREDAGPADLANAVHENSMVWIASAAALADDKNVFDTALKGRLLSLARWVLVESDRVLRESRNPRALADVNRVVMAGLRPVATPAPEMS